MLGGLEVLRAGARFYEGSGAVRLTAKQREIGGCSLTVVAYAWPSLRGIAGFKQGT
jgi:hypothetical protein